MLMHIAGFSGAAVAQTLRQQCSSPDPATSISACTAIISSGQETQENLARAFNQRGVAYFRMRQYRRAIEDYDEAIRLNPDFAIAFSNRGNAYALAGRYNRAIESYTEAIRLDSNYAEAFANRGNAYAGTGQHDRAIEDYNAAIRLCFGVQI